MLELILSQWWLCSPPCLQIIIDTYNVETKTIGEKKAFGAFYDTFCRNLFSRFVSVTFKTGRTKIGGQSGLVHCLNALGANSPVFLLDSVERPELSRVAPIERAELSRVAPIEEVIKEVKAKHKAIPRIVWVTEQRFHAIWGSKAQEKKLELADRKRELERLGAGMSNPDGHTFFRVATESLVIDMIAYADMLFRPTHEQDVKEDKTKRIDLCTYVRAGLSLESVDLA